VQQRGRTLIELLVSIALGLLILLGVGTLYLASNQSTRSATNVASAENVAQVALTLLGTSIRRSGYSEIIGTEYSGLSNNVLYAGPTLRACRGARFTGNDPGAACETTVAGAPDSIGIWYQSDNALAASQGATDDCVGTTPGTTAGDQWQLRSPRGEHPRSSERLLRRWQQPALPRQVPPTPQPLLTGVEDLKLYFGFDDFAYANPAVLDIVPTARSVRDAAFINGLTPPSPLFSPWDYVVSITACVLVRSEEVGVSAQGGSVTYLPCPQTAAEAAGIDPIAQVTATDGRLRRAVTQTFSVRVRTKPSPLDG
jgi:type IV pilus assembly protein PilW